MKAIRPNRNRPWSVIDKWGADVVATEHHGFLQVPDALIRYQSELRLTATELCVLLHVLRFWWYADEYPHPRISLLAREIGVSRRTVERTIGSLEAKGLMVRGKSEQKERGGPMVRRFLLGGLRERLRQLVSAKDGHSTTFPSRDVVDDPSLNESLVERAIEEFDVVSSEVLRA